MLYIYDVFKIYPLSLIISINNYILYREVKRKPKNSRLYYLIISRSSGKISGLTEGGLNFMSQNIKDIMSITDVKITDLTANPAPLGLMGFGMTTVLLNLHNAGFYSLGGVVLSMGIFYGGLAQVVAGIQEWKKGNTFGATAFTSYGFFWLSLVGIVLLPKLGDNFSGLALTPPDFTAYLILWGLFTLYMFIGTLKASRILQVVFLLLTILFFLLAAGVYLGNPAITHIAGFEGILTGFAAIYGAMGQVLNEMYGKKIIPL
jgi:succinate-acetate transporter protein